MKQVCTAIDQYIHIRSGNADVSFVSDTLTIQISEKNVCIQEVNVDRDIVIEIIVEPDASLDYIGVQSKEGVNIIRNARVGQHGCVRWFDICLPTASSHISTTTMLIGGGARGETYGVFIGGKTDCATIVHTTRHLASHTSSRMKTKGVLDGEARVRYEGHICIPKGVFGCDGYEQADTLLLSSDAHITAIPNLEIANNDVRCSHGVTTTTLSEESLFYVMSRGVSLRQARELLIQAHLAGVLDEVAQEQKKAIISLVKKKLMHALSS